MMPDYSQLLVQTAELLHKHRDSIAEVNTKDTLVSIQTNYDNIDRGISTLKQYANLEYSEQNQKSKGGIAIFSCYGDPSFALLGMTLAPALRVNGNETPILIGFPSILKNYANHLENLFQQSGLFPNLKIITGLKPFIKKVISNPDYAGAVIFGDEWIDSYTEPFAKNRKFLLYFGPGKNASVILPSANLKVAVQKTLESAFVVSGQAAVCINRCIIDDRVPPEEIREVFVNELSKINFGFDPFQPESFVTPLTYQPLVKQIEMRVQQACSMGGESISFKVQDRDSALLVHPSLIWNCPTESDLWKKYHFAPVLPVHFVSYDKIAKKVNQTDYGIYTSLWGNTKEIQPLSIDIIMEHIHVLKNQSILDLIPITEGYTGPWGGYKKSGFYLGQETLWTPKQGAYNLLNVFTNKRESHD